jgi:hypothetical protein
LTNQAKCGIIYTVKEREVHKPMIRKDELREPRNAFYWVEKVLADNRDYYLTKEEIYARIPRDSEDVPIVTISSLESAIRMLACRREINVEWVNGKRYFGYNEGEYRR